MVDKEEALRADDRLVKKTKEKPEEESMRQDRKVFLNPKLG